MNPNTSNNTGKAESTIENEDFGSIYSNVSFVIFYIKKRVFFIKIFHNLYY